MAKYKITLSDSTGNTLTRTAPGNSEQQELKDTGVSWYQLGKLMASEQIFGKNLANAEYDEFFGETKIL